jgi:hypothetical protein
MISNLTPSLQSATKLWESVKNAPGGMMAETNIPVQFLNIHTPNKSQGNLGVQLIEGDSRSVVSIQENTGLREERETDTVENFIGFVSATGEPLKHMPTEKELRKAQCKINDIFEKDDNFKGI